MLTEASDHNRGLRMGSYSAIVRMGLGGVSLGAALTDLFGHLPTLSLSAAVMAVTVAIWILTSRGHRVQHAPISAPCSRTGAFG